MTGTTASFNLEVGNWAREIATLMKSNVGSMTNQTKHKYIKARQTVNLMASIKSKTLQRFGEVERVVFPFAKHGFFLAVGASKSHSYKTNPRKSVPWFNFVFDSGINDLAEIIAEYKADSYIKAFDLGLKELK